MSAEVKEGFLCPICMSDLGDEIQLQVHFSEKHSKEDPVFLQNLKDIFGKAKKRILNQDEALFSHDSGRPFFDLSITPLDFGDNDPVSGVPNQRIRLLPQPKVVDHSELFKEERKRKLERNRSTNQVLIRLQKLMTDLPTDPGRRRLHEQSIVPWIDEELVKLCPYCAKTFNIVRRKHHCRLCGAILCQECSTAVTFDFARKVINPVTISRFQKSEADKPQEQMLSTPKSKLGSLFASKNLNSSHESLKHLKNLMDLKATEEQFHSCQLCLDILERQDTKVEKATAEPILVQFYERLQQHIVEGGSKGAIYREMSESLNRGEDKYNLSEAQVLRMKILKIAENVDLISKKISALDTDGPDPVSGLRLQLQQRIRMSAVNFVKDGLVGLPGLPSEEEFEILRKRRREDAERRVADEKEAAKVAKKRFEQQEVARRSSRLVGTASVGGSPAHAGTPKGVKHSNGFVLTPNMATSTCSSDDPMVQQIHNIQGFIHEARRMAKFDEVASLEENLRELQTEYQRSQQELEDNYSSFNKATPSKETVVTPSDSPHDDKIDEYDASGKNPFA